MATKLIETADGILVEVEVPDDEALPISGKLAHKVNAGIERIKPLLIGISRPIAEAWKGMRDEVDIEKAEVEIGFSFEGQGNLYVAKTKAAAHLNVKLIIKPLA